MYWLVHQKYPQMVVLMVISHIDQPASSVSVEYPPIFFCQSRLIEEIQGLISSLETPGSDPT